METLNQLLQRVSEAGIEFVIIGGYAGVLHGSSLVTRDVDIFTDLTAATVERLRAVLDDLHAYHRMTPQKLTFADNPEPGQSVKNLYLKTDLGTIDILSHVLGLEEFQQVKERAEWVELGGQKYRVLCLADLIRAKEAMGREKDLLAVKELKAFAALRQQKTDL